MKLKALAERLGAELRGEGDVEITGVAGLEEAQAGEVTFLANPKYAPLARKTRASAIIAKGELGQLEIAVLRTENPYLAFARAIDLFYQPPVYEAGIHPTAILHPSARVGARAAIGPYVVIEQDVVIGDDAVIHPHVVIYPHVHIGERFMAHAHAMVREHCVLGDDVILQNGAVIGCDGFGFAQDQAQGGRWIKITQSGPAVLEDMVEVQANSCVDRASIGETRVGRGAKIDNLVQVGHGCKIGEDTLLCAQVGLAGSSVVGNKVTLAGQVGVAGHCTVGDGAIATAQSGIRDVAPGKIVSGTPAIDNRQWLRAVFEFSKLPDSLRELRSRVRDRLAHE